MRLLASLLFVSAALGLSAGCGDNTKGKADIPEKFTPKPDGPPSAGGGGGAGKGPGGGGAATQ